MDERMRFVVDYERGLFSLRELCERYEISRKTGYKWLDRYHTGGSKALEDRSRAPLRCPHHVAEDLEQLFVEARKAHPSWGARKLLPYLQRRESRKDWPARSTVEAIMRRHHLVSRRPRRRRHTPLPPPSAPITAPNDLWAADFKGEFATRDALYCYPLTVTDSFSRYLLECHGLLSTKSVTAQQVFERIFREFGLPLVIRSDGGSPFASQALARLSRLSVWWIKLGIRPEVIQPSHPEQNGRHERMHRDLKRDATRPPKANLREQQKEFDRFRIEFNEVRPHEALGLRPPAVVYCPSPRPYPARVLPPEYPSHFEVRRVSRNGGIRWNGDWVNITSVLAEEYVGLQEVDDGAWDLYFGPVALGRFHEDERYVYGAVPAPGNRDGALYRDAEVKP